MNPVIYNACTVVLYVLEVFLGLSGIEIGSLFGFIGTFSGVGISYFLPSLFLLRGYTLFAPEDRSKNGGYVCAAYINFLLGVIFFFLFLANNVLLFIKYPHDPEPNAYCNNAMGGAKVY